MDHIASLLLPPASTCYPFAPGALLALALRQTISIGLAHPFAAFSRSEYLYIVQCCHHINRLGPPKLDLDTLLYSFGDVPVPNYDKLNTPLAIGLAVPPLRSCFLYITPAYLVPFIPLLSRCSLRALAACTTYYRDSKILICSSSMGLTHGSHTFLHSPTASPSLARLLTRRIFPPRACMPPAFRLLSAASISVAFARLLPFVSHCTHTAFFEHHPSPIFILDAHLLPPGLYPTLFGPASRSISSPLHSFGSRGSFQQPVLAPRARVLCDFGRPARVYTTFVTSSFCGLFVTWDFWW
ncbi:hypothetical protein MSAN_02482300 [Mycena sanguinolenta]|uniref:Uncharacterized protein n=1 Tax=Mycena sanguinolenta TaxID=230812 RepID=A0A8H6WTU4_9AGAR|nr:hypothetical protein MSAN_02482300 [Mycena sanguinolenta]